MARPPVTIQKRKRIPLSTRVAVLKRQCPPEKVAEIERNGGTLKDKYAKLLLHAKCALSGDELRLTGAQWDHDIPLALGGTNDPENIQAVAPKPHREKTDKDDADIARADRRKLYNETGRSSAKKHVKKIPQPTPEQRKAQYQRAKAAKQKRDEERKQL